MKPWPTKRVEEICDLVRGSSPRPKSDPRYFGGPIPRLMIEDITRDGWLVTPRVDTLTETGAKLSRSVRAGTIVMAVSGNIGLCAQLAVDACIHDGFVAFKDLREDLLIPTYFRIAMSQMRNFHRRRQAGAIFQNITTSDVKATEIPVPPLDEQLRIVKLLDEADELRNLRARADRRTSDLIPALFHEVFGDPTRNQHGLAIVSVEQAGRVQLGRQRAPKYQTGKFTRSYIRVANVFEDRIDISDLLSMDFDERDSAQYRLEAGDILLNEGQSTELVGRPAMWRNEIPDCCFQNTLIRFQPNRTKVLPEFALSLFLTYFRTGAFAKISSKTSNVAHLGAGRFAKMPFPLPSLPMQTNFATRVTEIRAMEAEHAASRRRLDDLFQSMLHRAFNGEL
jgi:restriction endonuclease S subunit